MELNYASKGMAGAALGTGIAGLTLGVLNGAGGLLGGVGGNVAGLAGAAVPAVESMLAAERERADDKARIARLEAEKYSDGNDISTYRQIKAEMNELRDRLTARLDGLGQQMGDQRVINQQTSDGILMARQEFKSGLELEAQQRRCADNKIILYANGTFQPKAGVDIVTNTAGTNGTNAVALTSTTPAYAPLYNPLES